MMLMPANDLLNGRSDRNIDLSSVEEGIDYATSQVIVKFNPETQLSEINDLKQKLGVSLIETTNTLGIELWTIRGLSVEEVIATYSQDPLIEYIQPNYTISLNATVPDDSSFNQLWGLDNTGQTGGTPDADIDAPEAWDIETGNNVVVGVIDTGVDYSHPDLNDNMWTNPGETPGNEVDDDGNGYVDDYYGYDFINDDGDPFDDYGHGTHVAGTIAAEGNNDIGVTGVSWSAEIMALKIFDASGFTDEFSAIQAVEYATIMGAKLTNNSWGGGGYSQALYDAIANAGEAGQLFIAAAGNYSNNNDVNPFYPASYDLDNIIAVAATDHNDQLSNFSHGGATSVDIGAPGSNIYSTIPGGGYASYSGTSMATPHVTGVASLIWSQEPELSALEVKERILSYVDPIEALQGITVSGGRLNAYNALTETEPLPGDIQGSKWNDLNGDGQWGAAEPGLGGWTVYLDQNQNGQLDGNEVSTVTDANGNYSFTALTPGNYTVAEVLQPGWKQTYPGLNGGFESGSFSSWLPIGSASIETSEFGSEPTEGTYQALVSNGSGSITDAELETFLGLTAGSLDSLGNGNATEGSAIKQTITVSAGTQLSFDWNFLTNEATPDSVYNDFGFISITSGSLNTLGNTNNVFVSSATSFNEETEFQSFSYTFTNAGTYSIGVGVVDVQDSSVDSALLVDDFSFIGEVLTAGGNYPMFVGSGEVITDIDFGNQQIEPSPALNLGFETGNFTDWNTIGDARIETAAFGSNPTEGEFQALITTGTGALSDTELESFLGLDAGDLDALGNGNATEGSALKLTPITVQAGDTLSFDWNFLTSEFTPDGTYNDFGFVSIASGSVSELADTNSDFVPFTGGFASETGYGSFAYEFTTAGTYTIGLGVTDVSDSAVDSALLVDNFQIIEPPTLNLGFETGDFADWNTIGDARIETAAFGSDPTEGNFQALITTGTGSLSDTELESFLGLDTGDLDALGNGNATEGSALKLTPITVQAGDTLSFDWNFLTSESTPSTFNDFGFVSIASGSVSELADTNSDFVPFGNFGSETGYGSFAYEFTTAGTYTISLGITDVGDDVFDSALLVDNFQIIEDPIIEPPTLNLGFETGSSIAG
jgi:subtilisin family serine protease